MQQRQDIRAMSERQWKASYFYARHKTRLRAFLSLSLLAVLGIVCLVTGFFVYALLFVDAGQDDVLAQSIAARTGLQKSWAQPGTDATIEVVSEDTVYVDESVDFAARVKNPSSTHLALFSYVVVGNQGRSEQYEGFILPGGEFMATAREQVADIGQVQRIEIVETRYVLAPTYPRLAQDVLPVVTTTPQVEQIIEDGVTTRTQVTFEAVNETAFDWSNVQFVAFVYNQGGLVRIGEVTFDQIRSNSRKEIQMNWTPPLLNVTNVLLIPQTNILN